MALPLSTLLLGLAGVALAVGLLLFVTTRDPMLIIFAVILAAPLAIGGWIARKPAAGP